MEGIDRIYGVHYRTAHDMAAGHGRAHAHVLTHISAAYFPATHRE